MSGFKLTRRPFAERAKMGLATSDEIAALMTAAEVLDRCINDDGEMTKCNGVAAEAIEALAALRASGILEEGT